MKKQMVATILCVYLMQLLLLCMQYIVPNDFVITLFFIAILLPIPCAVMHIIAAVKSYKTLWNNPTGQRELGRYLLRCKCILIPFYVVNFILGLLISLAFIVVPGLQIGLFIVLPLFIFYTYIILLSTSCYSLVLLYALYRSKMIHRKKLVLHIILQLTFVLDVLSQCSILKCTKHAPIN